MIEFGAGAGEFGKKADLTVFSECDAGFKDVTTLEKQGKKQAKK